MPMKDDLCWRYENDPTWRQLVDMFEMAYARGEFTPSDVRTAAVYAMVRYEVRACRSFMVNPGADGLPELRVDRKR